MEPNLLEDIYQHFLNSAKSFKDLVCKECDYSEATFYKKLASSKSSSLSGSEKANIMEMGEYQVNRIIDCINKHKDQ